MAAHLTFWSSQNTSCLAAQKHIHEIPMTLPRHLRRLVDAGMIVCMVDDRLLDLEEAKIHIC